MVLRNKVWKLTGAQTRVCSDLVCIMSSTPAIVEVAKVYQKENEHIRVYASKFNELHRFSRDTLTEESVISLFLNKVRKLLKVHAVGMKSSKPF